ncbi:glycine betaine transporter [Alkalithermobacter thermoalcaliphilus JW-YL-7 = DSM 7308]|uniref:Choline/carnitine/betaine transporter n=1 Tax=Alkalithermobacter thermoalcaliphilus JW-YL-7 = DSM 7308 TaxID=1121328 RepID=A0A150FSA5_CLOPD|nr:choline/carnitine/betaine transporter [[Clostridium] paradoxum JW-YL-7 = DSM 7308]SHL16526.1 glycine betaine transporter [[Clostridium] paradoxum JW-YL-7 = DSM 7308]
MKRNSVFIISLLVTFVIVLWGIVIPENFAMACNGLFNFLLDKFGWMYLITMFFFVVFSIFLVFSKYSDIKLGQDDSTPEYNYLSWFAMLFSAGMGIGLVFWGVAEPLYHYLSPVGFTPASSEAANFAIKTSFFHWGIHPWANYSVLGLALAYFQFRKNSPGLISSIFVPLIGEKNVKGWIGKTIDILAIFATVAGVATSLGLGTLQINSGLNYLFNIPTNTLVQIIIIAIVTVLFMVSAITGLDKGIKWLSNINLSLASILMILALILGPTVKIINTFTNGLGMYLNDFIVDSLNINPFGDNSWIGGWRIFYWAWWIAWAPFVGTFIARISKGRTIKEFIIGVTLVPALGSFLWFATFGTLGINLGHEVATQATQVTETAFFVVMNHYPLGGLISLVAVVLLCTFFITSADSATFVLGMMSSDGDLNPSTKIKVIWGIVQSLLALSLLLAGGLKTLQIGSIAAAFPFAIVMVLSCVSLLKALKKEKLSS